MNKERNQLRLCMSGVGRDWCRQLWSMQESGGKMIERLHWSHLSACSPTDVR